GGRSSALLAQPNALRAATPGAGVARDVQAHRRVLSRSVIARVDTDTGADAEERGRHRVVLDLELHRPGSGFVRCKDAVAVCVLDVVVGDDDRHVRVLRAVAVSIPTDGHARLPIHRCVIRVNEVAVDRAVDGHGAEGAARDGDTCGVSERLSQGPVVLDVEVALTAATTAGAWVGHRDVDGLRAHKVRRVLPRDVISADRDDVGTTSWDTSAASGATGGGIAG